MLYRDAMKVGGNPVPMVVHCAAPQAARDQGEHPPEDRQSRVPGFSQEALSRLTVLVVGAGALGGQVSTGLVRKGVRGLKVVDFDVVSLSNLARQPYLVSDVHSPKAWAIARNLAPQGAMGTRIAAWDSSFENALASGADLACDVIVSAVDDAQTRVAIARFALERKIPAVFSAASRNADLGYVFVQEVGDACFGCMLPDEVKGGRTPCPGSPAIVDLFMLLGGLVVYAIDTLFMERPRNWTLQHVCPSDADLTRSGRVPRREDCPICGTSRREAEAG